MQVQLGLKIPAVSLDGIQAEVELAGNVLVGLTFHQKLEDLFFARSK